MVKRVITLPNIKENLICHICGTRLIGQPSRIYTDLDGYIEVDTEVYCFKCKKWVWFGEAWMWKE